MERLEAKKVKGHIYYYYSNAQVGFRGDGSCFLP